MLRVICLGLIVQVSLGVLIQQHKGDASLEGGRPKLDKSLELFLGSRLPELNLLQKISGQTHNATAKGCGEPTAGSVAQKTQMQLWNEVQSTGAWSLHRPADDPRGPWNAYCELGLSACPNAAANQDYLGYAKDIGPKAAPVIGTVDSKYCKVNGFLEPAMRAMISDGEALQAKGQELCNTKYMNYGNWTSDRMKIFPYQDFIYFIEKVSGETLQVAGQMLTAYVQHSPSDAGTKLSAEVTNLGDEAMKYIGAYKCAMGDLACDIAYCGYTYCDKGSDGIGMIPDGCH